MRELSSQGAESKRSGTSPALKANKAVNAAKRSCGLDNQNPRSEPERADPGLKCVHYPSIYPAVYFPLSGYVGSMERWV